MTIMFPMIRRTPLCCLKTTKANFDNRSQKTNPWVTLVVVLGICHDDVNGFRTSQNCQRHCHFRHLGSIQGPSIPNPWESATPWDYRPGMHSTNGPLMGVHVHQCLVRISGKCNDLRTSWWPRHLPAPPGYGSGGRAAAWESHQPATFGIPSWASWATATSPPDMATSHHSRGPLAPAPVILAPFNKPQRHPPTIGGSTQ